MPEFCGEYRNKISGISINYKQKFDCNTLNQELLKELFTQKIMAGRINGLKPDKISSLGLEVYENQANLFHNNHSEDFAL